MGFDMEYGTLKGYSGYTPEMLEIPSETQYIGSGAFCDSDIRGIDLTTAWGLMEIMNDAFNGCYRLRSVEMNNGIMRISFRAFYACSALRKIDLPTDIEVIENEAFALCSKLTLGEKYLPFGIKVIGSRAFASAGLTAVAIPSTVEYIGDDAFYGCPLEYAYVSSKANIDVKNVFRGVGPDGGRRKVEIVWLD